MKLIITVDTEEDEWDDYSRSDYKLSNIERIPALQQIFDDFHVKPTYMITYSVANDEKCISIFKNILAEDKCEIGTHCHPWNTPPFAEEINEKNSMLCNLDIDLQYRKIKSLHEQIVQSFNIEPISFRSGRWGYNKNVAKNIYKLGYKIDTSITAYKDWTKYYGPDFTEISPKPFRFSCGDSIFKESKNGDMLQVPATIGYLQKYFNLCNSITNKINKGKLSKFGLIGVLDRLKLVNKVWLSPELSSSKKMIELTQTLIKKEYNVVNLMFHSPSFKAGLTPFVKSEDDLRRIIKNLKEYLKFTSDNGIEPIKLKDYLDMI